MKKTSVFETVKNYIGSEKFYGSIGEYIFWYIVTIFIATIVILIGAKAIDWFRSLEIQSDLNNLKKIYHDEWIMKILNVSYKNLIEIEEKFEKFHYKEFRELAEERKLTEKDYENFIYKIIEFREKLIKA